MNWGSINKIIFDKGEQENERINKYLSILGLFEENNDKKNLLNCLRLKKWNNEEILKINQWYEILLKVINNSFKETFYLFESQIYSFPSNFYLISNQLKNIVLIDSYIYDFDVKELLNCSNLEKLIIKRCPIKNIDLEPVFQLSKNNNLKIIIICDCDLEEINFPENILQSNAINLEYIDFSNNNLISINEDIFILPKLKYLNLECNENLTKIIKDFSKSLKHILINFTNISICLNSLQKNIFQ